jgi:hypothetical protein
MKIINLLLKNIEKEDVEQYNTDASSLLGHITANEKRLINRNIVRIGEKDIFDLEECDRLADKLVFGKMESSENEIFDEIEDAEQTLPMGSNNKIRNRRFGCSKSSQINRNGSRHRPSEMDKRCECTSRSIAICKNDGID